VFRVIWKNHTKKNKNVDYVLVNQRYDVSVKPVKTSKNKTILIDKDPPTPKIPKKKKTILRRLIEVITMLICVYVSFYALNNFENSVIAKVIGGSLSFITLYIAYEIVKWCETISFSRKENYCGKRILVIEKIHADGDSEILDNNNVFFDILEFLAIIIGGFIIMLKLLE